MHITYLLLQHDHHLLARKTTNVATFCFASPWWLKANFKSVSTPILPSFLYFPDSHDILRYASFLGDQKKHFFFEVTKMILGQTDTVLENHSKKSHASKIMYQARCSPKIREVAWSCIESFRILKLQNFDVRLLGKFFTDFFFSSQKCLKIQYLDKSSTIPFAVCRLKENEILGLYYAQSSCWKLLPHPHWILIFKANQNQDFWCQKPLLRGF